VASILRLKNTSNHKASEQRSTLFTHPNLKAELSKMAGFKTLIDNKTLVKNQKSLKSLEMERDEEGKNILTQDFIKNVCELNGQYLTPKLNDTLYLHFKGFRKIEGLEQYTNLKSIWLEGNGIEKIRGLENQSMLKMIYLQQNQI